MPTKTPDTSIIGGWPVWLYAVAAVLAVAVTFVLWRRDVVRPGSLNTGQPRSIGLHPAAVWLGMAVGLWLVCVLSAAAAQDGARLWVGNDDSIRRLGVVLGITYVLAVPLALGSLWLLRGRADTHDLWPGARTWARAAGWGVVSLIAFVPFWAVVNATSTIVATWVTGRPPDVIAHATLGDIVDATHGGSAWVWAVLAAVVVGAPVVEECLYRGLVQTGVARATGSRWAAVVIASALFTAAHAGSVPAHGLPVLFALSVAMGVLYERTGNLLAPITMHVLFNSANVAMAVLG